MAKRRQRNRSQKNFKFLFQMKKKLLLLFSLVIACLAVMVGRLAYIEVKSGEKYEKIVLNNQEYSSTTIPFRRGDIVDRKGTVLATSTDVYNVILDCSVISADEDYLEPTMEALAACFDEDELLLTIEEIRTYISEHPDKQYYKIANQLSYEEITAFEELQEENSKIKGIWFEKEYVREYPYGSLASALIGYTASGNLGLGGIEDSYNDVLNGTDGRQYGYLNQDSDYEVTIKEAVDGQTVVSTIDANLQSIVESKVEEFYDALTNNAEERGGAEHIMVLMMDPDTGEVLAMANYPNYDYTLTTTENLELFYSDEEIEAMDEDELTDAADDLKQNYCITYTYEPGSTAKPFTIACGLDTGTLTEDMTFYCDGYEEISGHIIHCVNRSGHGIETMSETLENSCNDALMQMSYKIGAENFAKYQQIFNFGLKTNIDLPGKTRTDSLIYSEENLNTINLATNSFGQNFNVTMIQLASAYCSLVNGGNYYLPHVVQELTDENGNTVKTIEPTLLRTTVSSETSETIVEYLQNVVDEGTGSTAKVDGYSMCGKTGTAEKYILDEDGNATSTRADGRYLVSFIGSVPANDPEVVIYVIVDEPNLEDQGHSSYAQNIVREILEEALPYLNIYPDEELTGKNADLNIIGGVGEISVSTSDEGDEDAATSDEDAVTSEDTTGDSTEETSDESGDETIEEESGA
ncbi:MAG: penicillin-binding protein 2 [Clostridiales bacterium]|nr:penicillin-binding protein 2 [Clostridiales bacterium]